MSLLFIFPVHVHRKTQRLCTSAGLSKNVGAIAGTAAEQFSRFSVACGAPKVGEGLQAAGRNTGLVIETLRKEAASALSGYDTPVVGWLRGVLGGSCDEVRAPSEPQAEESPAQAAVGSQSQSASMPAAHDSQACVSRGFPLI